MGVVANLVIKVTASVSDFEKQMAGLERTLGRTGDKLKSIGSDLTKGLTLPIAAIGGGALKMAADFETSFSGVRKTVVATEEQFAQLAAGMRALAQTKPVDVNVLNKIGEQAGQLGVPADNILKFTSVIADLTVATNLTADQAGSSMAKIANVMRMPLSDIDRMGSAVVALGNQGAATEQDMLNFAERIAGAGAVAGLTVPNVLAIGNAFASAGIEAERGGTAIQKTLLAMTTAVTTGKHLKDFAKIAGETPDQFKQQFNTSPSQAFLGFVQGLHDDGRGAIGDLASVGLKDQRLVGSFLNMASAVDVLRESLNLGSKAWDENAALTHAAEQRYNTFSNELQLFWNRLKDVGITLGIAIMPAAQDLLTILTPLASGVGALAGWFAQLPEPVRLVAVGLGAVVAAAGPVVYVLGTMTSATSGVAGLLKLLGGAAAEGGAAAAGATTGFGLLTSGLVLLGQAVLVAGAAFAGWELGSWIDSLTGLSDGFGRVAARFGEWIGLLPQGTAAQYEATQAAREQAAAVAELHKQLGYTFRTTDINLPTPTSGGGAKSGGGATAAGATVARLTPPKIDEYTRALQNLKERLAGTDVINTAAQWTQAINEIGGAAYLTKDEWSQYADAIGKAVEKMRLLGQTVPETWAVIAQSAENAKALKATTDMLGESLKGGLNHQQLLLPATTGDTAGLMNAVPQAIASQGVSATVAGISWGAEFSAGLSSATSGLGTVIERALQGGGDVGRSIGGLFGGNLTQGLATKLSGSLSSMFGKTIGGALGSVIPGLGTLLGSMIGPLIGKLAGSIWHGIQGIFGKDEEARDVNPARDAFFAQFGGANLEEQRVSLVQRLNSATGDAGQTDRLMTALLKSDTMTAFTAATTAINAALDSASAKTSDALTTANDAADGLNLTLSGSDEAIKALGDTQDRVVSTMLAGFDKLLAKLQEFVGRFTTGGTAPAVSGAVRPSAGVDVGPTVAAYLPDGVQAAASDAISGGAIVVNIGTVQTPDADSFLTDLATAIRRNADGVRTELQIALGVA